MILRKTLAVINNEFVLICVCQCVGASFPFGFFGAPMAFLSSFLGTSLGCKGAKFFKAFLLQRARTSERSGCAPSGCSLFN